jgi:hypothetical protein
VPCPPRAPTRCPTSVRPAASRRGGWRCCSLRRGDEKDRRRDLKDKRRDYAAARIPEHWIVDPQERAVTVLARRGKACRIHGVFAAGQRASSVLLPGFGVDVSALSAAK